MGPRELGVSSTLAPWSMAVDRHPVLPSKIPVENGGSAGQEKKIYSGYSLLSIISRNFFCQDSMV